MFSQLIPFIALATFLIPVPSRAVPGAAWVRRQEDAQSSPTLDPAVISHGLEQDGQGNNPDPGQVRSLTSSNNFINFCLPFLDQGVVLTNGAQVVAGSCNQTPMGRIISLDLAPRSKFVFPPNGDESIAPNTAFTVKMKLLNMQAGNFVNAATNYYAAPQQVNSGGILIGHTHFVIEPIPSLDTTEPLDPLKFAFFKGINNAVDGDNIVQTTVTAGLPAGVYRLCSINTAANHQPALVSNAQHGALDDCSYFTIKDGGNTAEVSTSASVADNASTTAAASATDSAAASASTDSTSNTDAASTTDAATNAATDASTDSATDAPQATDSVPAADNSASASSTDTAQASATPAPDSITSTDAAAPTDNGNANGNNGDNNNGGNNGNQGNNNNNNGGNSGNNGDNQNAPSDNSSSAPPPTDDSSSAPAPTDATPTDATPSDNAPSDNTPSADPTNDSSAAAAPTSDSSAAPAPTDASQGNNNGAGNGDNNNQGGNDSSDAPASTA